jgi:hypothetical protein
MKLKRYNEFLTENMDDIKADMYAQDSYKNPEEYSELEDMMSDEDNIWFVTDSGRVVSAWSYLKDAIWDGIVYDNLEVDADPDQYDAEEEIDSYLSSNGWGEDYEEMEEYDQDELDIFIDELLGDWAPSKAGKMRVVKKTELM